MTWLPLLLADPSPILRYLVLKNLLQRPIDDSEVHELSQLRENDALVAPILSTQQPDGSWNKKSFPALVAGSFRLTCIFLKRLAYLGFPSDHPIIQRGIEYLFSKQGGDGGWPLFKSGEREGNRESQYTMIPLQTALPLHVICACGYGMDPRAEKAFEWLLSQKLDDGAWPAGLAAGNYGRVGGYRRIAHSLWGCRTNTVCALTCFAYHPLRRNTSTARKALDLILGTEIRDRKALGFELSRTFGFEPCGGVFTYYAKYDVAFFLDLCRRVGATRDDDRVESLIRYVKDLQNSRGLWTVESHPEMSRWVTYDLIQSLKHIDESGTWVSDKPRIFFQSYPKKQRRY